MTARARSVASVGSARDIAGRVKSVEWQRIFEDLDARGSSRIEKLLGPEECDALVALYQRPVQGTRGVYRVNLRHGVSRVRSGSRHTVGVIFHDAT